MTVAEAKAKVVNWALAQVGYHEKATNSNLDSFTGNSGSANWNKYAADIDKNYPTYFNTAKNSFEWCTSFVTDDFLQNFGLAATHAMLYTPSKCAAAGCIYAVDYFKAAGAYYSTPEVGDQWFAKDPDDGKPGHTGIVVAVNGGQFTIVEGNKNNRVEKNVYNVGGYTTHGFGRPKWSVVATPTTYTEGWQKDSNGWWYRYKDGSYPKDCWKKIDEEWYCFDGEGYILTHQWTTDNGNAYYLNGDGKMVTNQTLIIDGEGRLIPFGAFFVKLGDVKYPVYREALDAAIAKDILKGYGGSGDEMIINMSEEAVRMFVFLYRAGVF
jgi:hypothetical protein